MRWLAALAMAVPLWALDPSLSLSQYARKLWQVEDGLPQNYVTWISQSADGYLLVGTSGGAARFDGLRFTPLVLDSATGISREWITVVQPGADGKTIWVATRDAGFYELGVRHWPMRLDNMIVNRQGDPVGLGPGLYQRLDGAMKPRWPGLRPADPSWSGLLDVPGAGLMAAAAQGLFLFRDTAKAPSLLLPPTAPEGKALSLAAARRGGMWIGTSQGFFHTQLQSGRPGPLTPIQGVRGPVVSIVEDRDNVVWVGTWGFGMWRVTEGKAERFTTRDGLPDDFVHALFEDREGNLWIGTRAGLSRWKSTPVVPFGQAEGLDGQFVSTVMGDASGNTWIGTWRSGLYRLHDGGSPVRVRLPGPDLNVLVRATAVAPDGAFWLSDWHGLYRQEGSRWRQFDAAALGYTPSVHALLFDRSGQLWVGADEGLFRHGAGGLGRAEPKLQGHSVRALIQDSKGRVWAGGVDGLWRVDGEAAAVQIKGLPNRNVASVSEDSAGRIWVTTRANGLAVVEESGAIRVLDHRHGLPALPLYAAVDDGHGALWLSSPAGLFQVQLALLADVIAGKLSRIPVIPWGQEDGMRTIECQNVGQPSAWKDRSGDLWFTTVRGAVRVRPRAVRMPDAPAVLIESAETVRQSHNVRFTAARLGAPARVEFRYRMPATQPDWTFLGSERALRYDSLPAGTHTLLIAARENGGEWGQPAEVHLTQAPRWHETWWFRLLAVLAGAGVLTALYRWRVYLLRVRYSAMIAERNRIAREWHDTLLAGFSAISWQLDMTLKRIRDKPDAAVDTVEVARTMVQHYRAEARRVIWDLRHDGLEQTSLAETISSALQQMTEGRGIVSDVAVEGSVRAMPGEVAQNLLRICQEAAGNAIRHGEPARIDVKLQYAASTVGLTVRDDGRGFDPRTVTPGHFGIEIMAERARRFGGEFAVVSSAGAGTTVTAAIPLDTAR